VVGTLFERTVVAGETRTGLIGEHIACAAALCLPGVNGASLCQQDMVDMIVWDDVGYLRIQVKSCRIRHESDKRTPTYHFNYGMGLKKKKAARGSYDIIASVAIDQRRVLFTALDEVKAISKRISPRYFDDPDIEIDSWRHALAVVRGEA